MHHPASAQPPHGYVRGKFIEINKQMRLHEGIVRINKAVYRGRREETSRQGDTLHTYSVQ